MQLFSNNFSTTVAGSTIGAGATTFTVTSVTGLPAEGEFSGDNFAMITVEDATGNMEIMRLESYVAATKVLTVTREQEGTTEPGTPFPVGSRVELRMTAGTLEGYLQRTGDTINGGTFGTGAAAADVIRLKYSTDAAPAVPTLETGELAFVAKSRILMAGGLDSGGASEDIVLYPGIFVQSTAPADPVTGTLWYDTTAGVTVLKMYVAAAWVVVYGVGRITTAFALANAVAIVGSNAAASALYDLIQVNASNEFVIGDTDLALVKVLGSMFQVSPSLRVAAADEATNGTWTLTATADSGAPRATLVPSKNNTSLRLQAKATDGTERNVTINASGTVTLPAGINPVADDDAVRKAYVDGLVGNAASFAAFGRVLSGGTATGDDSTYSVVKNSTGDYTVTLTTALTDYNNAIIAATINDSTLTVDYGRTISAWFTDNDTMRVLTRKVGNNATMADADFTFAVFEPGV